MMVIFFNTGSTEGHQIYHANFARHANSIDTSFPDALRSRLSPVALSVSVLPIPSVSFSQYGFAVTNQALITDKILQSNAAAYALRKTRDSAVVECESSNFDRIRLPISFKKETLLGHR